MPAKKFVYVTNCCKKNCRNIMNAIDQKAQFKSFYVLDKQNQDTFLMNNIERFDIKNASADRKTNNRNFCWHYHVTQKWKKTKSSQKFSEEALPSI